MTTLKNVLLINAVSSGATGLGLLVVPGIVATLFGVPLTQPFLGVGIFLFAFAALVFIVSRNKDLSKGSVRLIIVLDVVWVVASFVIVLLQLFDLSALGYISIFAVAAWVGLMAYLQFNGLKNLTVSK
jgi:hypothetical protein